jgi:hypothetical protein
MREDGRPALITEVILYHSARFFTIDTQSGIGSTRENHPIHLKFIKVMKIVDSR